MRNYTPPEAVNCVLPEAPCREPMISAKSFAPIIQGKLHFPCAGLRQLPLSGLAVRGHLAPQAVPGRQVYKIHNIPLYFFCRKEYNVLSEKSGLEETYMIDFIVNLFAEIADFFITFWVDNVIDKFAKKK